MDDILFFGKDREEHDRNLRAVMQTVRASGLKLNREKCQFGKSEIKYFGHIVGKDGIKPSTEKVRAISDLSNQRHRATPVHWDDQLPGSVSPRSVFHHAPH